MRIWIALLISCAVIFLHAALRFVVAAQGNGGWGSHVDGKDPFPENLAIRLAPVPSVNFSRRLNLLLLVPSSDCLNSPAPFCALKGPFLVGAFRLSDGCRLSSCGPFLRGTHGYAARVLSIDPPYCSHDFVQLGNLIRPPGLHFLPGLDHGRVGVMARWGQWSRSAAASSLPCTLK